MRGRPSWAESFYESSKEIHCSLFLVSQVHWGQHVQHEEEGSKKSARGPNTTLWLSAEEKEMHRLAAAAANHGAVATWIKVTLQTEAVRLLGREAVDRILKGLDPSDA